MAKRRAFKRTAKSKPSKVDESDRIVAHGAMLVAECGVDAAETALFQATGRIITVFGCGGDRDKTKRRPMGKVAAEYSDAVVITSDNPRNEDPLKIISEIEAGVKETGKTSETISDRRDAIHRAIGAAKTGDVVIIAGKGHENYQIVGDDRFHFDDREVAIEAIVHRDHRAEIVGCAGEAGGREGEHSTGHRGRGRGSFNRGEK